MGTDPAGLLPSEPQQARYAKPKSAGSLLASSMIGVLFAPVRLLERAEFSQAGAIVDANSHRDILW
ncbi:hypothetical protein [Microbulbifer sp. 2205BS26-8]|uniref:hypothetical protein n=1 Tax=Microbulbifer sp. 2205BS26-8 TaxID=3064386 RepID=UPI00273D8F2C|nr:hypothetical protein [Microbulbifer sp. 2205BS26-8]MDP5209654.1 hypothetical protein [Microbulbifer sp. 2205BS26-8]